MPDCKCAHAEALHRKPHRLVAWWWNLQVRFLIPPRPCSGRPKGQSCTCFGYRPQGIT